MSEVTLILERAQQGDPKAAEALLPLVYEELRKLAAHRMAQELPEHTLQPTALVHEAWLRLTGGEPRSWDNRGHFFAAAAEAMRRILVENARRKRRLKHGGGQERVALEGLDLPGPLQEDKILDVDEALAELAAIDSDQAQVVRLRFFGTNSGDHRWKRKDTRRLTSIAPTPRTARIPHEREFCWHHHPILCARILLCLSCLVLRPISSRGRGSLAANPLPRLRLGGSAADQNTRVTRPPSSQALAVGHIIPTKWFLAKTGVVGSTGRSAA